MKFLSLITAILFMSFGVFAQIFTSKHFSEDKLHKQDVIKQKELTMITHSASQTILSGNSFYCAAGPTAHDDNSYYRVFDLEGDFEPSYRITNLQIVSLGNAPVLK